jgi:hypothetical protein
MNANCEKLTSHLKLYREKMIGFDANYAGRKDLDSNFEVKDSIRADIFMLSKDFESDFRRFREIATYNFPGVMNLSDLKVYGNHMYLVDISIIDEDRLIYLDQYSGKQTELKNFRSAVDKKGQVDFEMVETGGGNIGLFTKPKNGLIRFQIMMADGRIDEGEFDTAVGFDVKVDNIILLKDYVFIYKWSRPNEFFWYKLTGENDSKRPKKGLNYASIDSGLDLEIIDTIPEEDLLVYKVTLDGYKMIHPRDHIVSTLPQTPFVSFGRESTSYGPKSKTVCFCDDKLYVYDKDKLTKKVPLGSPKKLFQPSEPVFDGIMSPKVEFVSSNLVMACGVKNKRGRYFLFDVEQMKVVVNGTFDGTLDAIAYDKTTGNILIGVTEKDVDGNLLTTKVHLIGDPHCNIGISKKVKE